MNEGNSSERLFNALAEYLRVPLVSIARGAELNRDINHKHALINIETSATSAINLIDNFLLAQKINQNSLSFELEPVTVSSVLYDAAHELEPLARTYSCSLVLDCHNRQAPVIAHLESLRAALTSLGHVFIQASTKPEKANTIVTLASHRTKAGTVVGIFGNTPGLSGQMYRQARFLYGQAKVPLGELAANSGVAVFVADQLLGSMSARLRVARHDKLNGLATTLVPSLQLSLV